MGWSPAGVDIANQLYGQDSVGTEDTPTFSRRVELTQKSKILPIISGLSRRVIVNPDCAYWINSVSVTGVEVEISKSTESRVTLHATSIIRPIYHR